ncbi:MAG: helix-turn-helix domain-containing protein [Chryseobacterium sp.]|nr:MAG: helix-turn-helix domain-containing protein [Chryseobacterium sp.]
MSKAENLIDILEKIYVILHAFQQQSEGKQIQFEEIQMTRQEVKDYLGISESTYKRKVKDGSLKPLKLPGGDRFFKRQLLFEFEESKRRGRI